MPTVYARLEPTTDSATAAMIRSNPRWANPQRHRDVVIYHDKGCRRFYCRFPWHYDQSKPTRRNKYVTVNCYRYALVWLA